MKSYPLSEERNFSIVQQILTYVRHTFWAWALMLPGCWRSPMPDQTSDLQFGLYKKAKKKDEHEWKKILMGQEKIVRYLACG